MASSATSFAFESDTRIEDLLAYLPLSRPNNYRKGQMIYGPDQRSMSLYLVVSGTVRISQIADDGSEVLLEIVRPDEVFGESAFLDASRPCELATAGEKATLMAWPISDMEDLVTKRPRLAVALLQMLAQRNAEFSRRIESLSVDSVERRLARSLIRFSQRLGSPEEDGSVSMMPLTHAVLSRYIGTSREVVTQCMIQFRKRGYLTYSRSCIRLYHDLFKTFLDTRRAPTTSS